MPSFEHDMALTFMNLQQLQLPAYTKRTNIQTQIGGINGALTH